MIFSILFILSLSIPADSAPTFPYRIGGTVTVGNTQLTQTTDTGYTFKVTKQDGSNYNPSAEDSDGLNTSNFYLMDIPLSFPAGTPGSAKPGDKAILHVYKNGKELTVTQPANGVFIVGNSGASG